MKTQALLAALAAVPGSLAHTVFTDFYVNGVAQGDGVAMRMPKSGDTASYPIENLASNDMACNVDGETGVSRVQTVSDGATVSFEFRSWPNDPTKERLDTGHKGPCAVYLKKVDSAVDDAGHGDGWFKIHDDGYNADEGKWCTDKLIANNGLYSVVLPKGLKGGYYLARPEILALHNAAQGDPQFYAGCAQIFLESSGDLVPESTVSIPGYVKAGGESVSFNIYNRDNAEYPVPGPAVAKLSSSSSAAGADLSAQTTQSEGKKPSGVICENGNWFGYEVPDYSNEAGCWASGQKCWDQATTCWDTAPVTGGAGCELWQSKCQAINDACTAKDWTGPPNKGKVLTPKAETIDVGLVLPTSGGGVENSTPKTSSAAAVKSSAAVYTTTSAAAAVKTSAAGGEQKPVETSEGGYEAVVPTPAESPKTTYKQATTEAPEPTKLVCPDGYVCVTSTTTVVETEVVYSTVYGDMKRRSLMNRRR
ncbi:glycosyl hydrolase family 61-domain-containing protein [Lophiotrema nucula]|uniref:AA9 family lytic polysaccharide monooxygenase n=1 Tax=Lophiotrema nucula TaxID=690887 RepID=A0A6A5ZT74_9PLEO|nr:glycosyl hydrolase family 61-domain-containing protein [Lophiotrema nucula]